MKIVTWNVNSINSRLDRLLAFLKTRTPDIICLQELKGPDEKFPLEAIKNAGYHSAIFGQKTYNGVAILSKEAPLQVERGFGDGIEDPAARFISARFEQIRVLCAYVPNGQAVGSDKYVYKLAWLQRLKNYLETKCSMKENLLLVGDFNVAPEDEDVHDPDLWHEKILCSTPERKAFREILNVGLVDLYRELNPQGRDFTWWDYRNLGFVRNLGLRIDLILGTRPLLDRVNKISGARITVDREERKGEKPSDHAPVMAEIPLE